jgi:uncharacterized protein YggE
VRASGEATVTAKPDRALIDIGVVTRAATAQAASTQNAAQSTQVLNSIRQILGSAGEVKTSGYSLSPRYDDRVGQSARLTGYDASNTVLVTVDDLPILGKIIDAATNTGANNITGISFTLKNDTAVRAEALRQATVKARENAEVLAKALEVRVIGVLQAEPSEAILRPRMQSMQMIANRAAPSTPIESGDLDIHATVTVTLEIR